MLRNVNPEPKRIVFYSWDAIGHINPLISIAKELRARGHFVCFLTFRELNFKDTFKETGLNFYHCLNENNGQDASKKQNTNVSTLNTLKEIFRKGPRCTFMNIYDANSSFAKRLDELIENHVIISARLQQLKPDLILVDSVIGIPCTTSIAPKWCRFFSPFTSILYSNVNETIVAGLGLSRDEMLQAGIKQFEIDTKAQFVAKVKQFFVSQGLEAWPGDVEIAPSSPYLNFCMGPLELSFEGDKTIRPLDKTWVRLEHTIDEPDPSARFSCPEKLNNLPGKLIYFSLGTLVTSDTDMINRLLRILSKSPNRFIVSMGHRHDEIKLHANMWGQKYLDQKAILPHLDLFITHGGHNSIIEAFYYGVPGLIVLPVFADQFDLAQRVHNCGFGKRLSPYDCVEGELLSAIDELTHNHGLAARMKAISSRLKSIECHKIAADHIESLIG